MKLLIITYLAKSAGLLKNKPADNERVSQRSGCSVVKNGTLKCDDGKITLLVAP